MYAPFIVAEKIAIIKYIDPELLAYDVCMDDDIIYASSQHIQSVLHFVRFEFLWFS